MTAKTIIDKQTKEFVHFVPYSGFFREDYPEIISPDQTNESFKKYLIDEYGERAADIFERQFKLVEIKVEIKIEFND